MPTPKTRIDFPELGSVLRRRYRRRKFVDDQIYEAKVVAVDRKKGWVSVALGGVIYKSLSAAARSITGYQVDGWIFWGLEPARPSYYKRSKINQEPTK